MNLRLLLSDLKRKLTHAAPLIELRIRRSALLHNLYAYQDALPGIRVAPVLKSNAYGHGLVRIAHLLDNENIAFFMVDSLYEARVLRRYGVRSRILVMGYARPEQIAGSRLKDVDFAVVALSQLTELTRITKHPVRIHLKLDTGMHRQGIMPAELPVAIALLKEHQHLQVVGVGSHFGDADGEDESHTKDQVSVWKEALQSVLAAFPAIEYKHLAATKGVRFAKDAGTNVVRVGIGLYGVDTSPFNKLALSPVLSLHSLISSVREINEGDWVGYNATYTAPGPRRIACVPVGYYEGVDRALSGKGAFLVAGKPCPIVGRVSMNMTSIDVTDVPEVVVGSPVIAISDRAEDPNSIEQMAVLSGTTPYVLFAHLPPHLWRSVENG